jgi:hypothetical protein
MLPKTHIIVGAIFSISLYLIFNISLIGVSLIFLSSFLIDFDHYLYGAIKKRTLNFEEIYNYFLDSRIRWRKLSYIQKNNTKFPVLIFHGFEALILLFFLSFISQVFLFIFIGAFFHMIIDYLEIFLEHDPLYTKISILYVWLSNKYKKEL